MEPQDDAPTAHAAPAVELTHRRLGTAAVAGADRGGGRSSDPKSLVLVGGAVETAADAFGGAIYFGAPSLLASSSESTLPPFLVANVSASSFHAKATSEAGAALSLPPAT